MCSFQFSGQKLPLESVGSAEEPPGSGLTVGRPPSMKREISRKPELSQGWIHGVGMSIEVGLTSNIFSV